jgi:DNA-binding response OmpR family regulator
MTKILVVEDDKEVAESLARFLASREYESMCAFDSDEALASIKKNKPAIILLDIQLPGSMDGIGVLRETKAMDPNTKVIMMTGYVGEEEEDECKKLGADDYMIKPIDFMKMITLIKKYC